MSRASCEGIVETFRKGNGSLQGLPTRHAYSLTCRHQTRQLDPKISFHFGMQILNIGTRPYFYDLTFWRNDDRLWRTSESERFNGLGWQSSIYWEFEMMLLNVFF